MKPLTFDQFRAVWLADPITAMNREAKRIADCAMSDEHAFALLESFVGHFINLSSSEVEAGMVTTRQIREEATKLRFYLSQQIESINPPWLTPLSLDFTTDNLDFAAAA